MNKTERSSSVPDDAPMLAECRAVHDALRRFASSRSGIWTMFLWALGEATIWPVIPEAILVPMAAFSTRRAWLIGAAIAGSAVGALATFGFGYVAPSPAHWVLIHLPFVFDRQIADVDAQLSAHGAWALLAQPWSGISFKIWGVEAARQRFTPLLVIPIFVGSRALRMTFFGWLAAFAGYRTRTFIRDFSIFVLVAYVVLFTLGWWQVITR